MSRILLAESAQRVSHKLRHLGIRAYVVGVQPHASVWALGTAPLPSPRPAPAGRSGGAGSAACCRRWTGKGRPPTRRRRADGHRPVAAKDLALTLPATAWQTVTWRDGVKGELNSRFAAVRVRPGHRDYERPAPWPELWLLVEWPEGEAEPDQALVRQPRRRHGARAPRCSRQAALADRAGLPGAQAGTRPRTLRGPRLAGLPPSCLLVHRRLRLPGPRADSPSPHERLVSVRIAKAFLTRDLSAARLQASLGSATSPPPSPPCATTSPSCSPDSSTTAPAAGDGATVYEHPYFHDTVRLVAVHVTSFRPTTAGGERYDAREKVREVELGAWRPSGYMLNRAACAIPTPSATAATSLPHGTRKPVSPWTSAAADRHARRIETFWHPRTPISVEKLTNGRSTPAPRPCPRARRAALERPRDRVWDEASRPASARTPWVFQWRCRTPAAGTGSPSATPARSRSRTPGRPCAPGREIAAGAATRSKSAAATRPAPPSPSW